MHLGTLLAILIYFRNDLLNLVLEKEKRKILLYIVIATLPVVIIGFSCKSYIESSEILRSSKFISFTLISVALLMWFFDRKLENSIDVKSSSNILNLGFMRVLNIGFAQCCALLPGSF